LAATTQKNEQPVGCDAHVAGTQIGRYNIWGIVVIFGGKFFRGIGLEECLGVNCHWGISRNVCGKSESL